MSLRTAPIGATGPRALSDKRAKKRDERRVRIETDVQPEASFVSILRPPRSLVPVRSGPIAGPATAVRQPVRVDDVANRFATEGDVVLEVLPVPPIPTRGTTRSCGRTFDPHRVYDVGAETEGRGDSVSAATGDIGIGVLGGVSKRLISEAALWGRPPRDVSPATAGGQQVAKDAPCDAVPETDVELRACQQERRDEMSPCGALG